MAYDPNSIANICFTHYEDGEKQYILHPWGIKIGGTIISSIDAPILVGNALPLSMVWIIDFCNQKTNWDSS